MAGTEGDAPQAEPSAEQTEDRIRELNERIITSAKQAGEVTLDAYAKMLQSIAGLQENVGKTSQLDWLTTFTTAQANFTRDLAQAYTAAARKLGGS